jgi:DNA recombination protein RmuC
LEERLESKENESREKLKFLEEAKKLMGAEFENLSTKIFETKSKQFTEINKDSIQNLLNPIQTKMKDFQEKVEKFHIEDVSGRASIKAEFEHFKEVSTTLSQDAQNLTTALTGDSKQQGDWGEMILEKCLQNAGLIEGEHYQKQIQIKTDDGTQQRPDFIINLPNERIMIADSKVSLKAYNSYMSEDDEERRKNYAKRHLQSVRNHIQGLSSKSYQEGFQEYGSPDYVLMFMQIESAYSLAQKLDSSLTSDAFNKNIIIVTPASLMMVVGIVNQLWRQEKQVQNVKDIFERGAKLYEKINGFLEDFVKIGDKLSDANVSYDNAYNKLSEGRGSIIRQAEMLKKLGLKTNKSAPREFKNSLEDISE